MLPNATGIKELMGDFACYVLFFLVSGLLFPADGHKPMIGYSTQKMKAMMRNEEKDMVRPTYKAFTVTSACHETIRCPQCLGSREKHQLPTGWGRDGFGQCPQAVWQV